MKTRCSVLPFLAAALISVSCASSPQGGDRSQVRLGEGTATLATDGSRFILYGGILRASRIDGIVEVGEGGLRRLHPERLRWFSNWTDGWTEAVFVLTGEAELRFSGDAGRLSAAESPEWEYAESASIRFRDEVLRGDQALSLLDRRMGRIESVVAFLKEELDRPFYPYFRARTKRQAADAFYRPVAMLLLPELYGYPAGSGFGKPERADRLRGEGVSWNAAYSRDRIPEELREVRNAGTLFRDWEEAAELFYLRYIWDALWASD